MKAAIAHPGRSPEFLSRLHDGDLSAGERAQFESHRAHCSECRGAAAQFEAALALFRSNLPRPPAPDLSARILRKLQTVSPRRSPLGVSFGIDLRWAGAFAAALLAVIIGSEVVLRREAAERRLASSQSTIPVTVESQPRSSDSARRDSAAANAENERKVPPAAAGAPASEARPPENTLKELPPSESRNQPAFAPAPRSRVERDEETTSKDDGRLVAAAPSLESKPQSPPAARANKQAKVKTEPGFIAQLQERAGGEGGQTSKLATDALAAPPRLELTALDGVGPVPALANANEIEVPAELKGRAFVLVVEASGRVLEARPDESALRKKAMAQEMDRQSDVSSEKGAATEDKRRELTNTKGPPSLLALRFQPGDRPRLLRVRVE
jgi:hypothetical protein